MAAISSPQVVRPNVASAIPGPSTPVAADQPALTTMNCNTMIQTQGRATNSRQPSTRSRRTFRPPSVAPVEGTRRREKATPAAANVRASTPIAQPGPHNPTATPPADIPANIPSCLAIPTEALACLSRARGTVWGVRAAEAGRLAAAAAPFTTLSAIMSGSEAVPVSSVSARVPWESAASAQPPTSTIERGSRSAITPPSRRSATFAMDRAPTTRPTWVREPVTSRTAKASATVAMPLPNIIRTRPDARARKFP